MPVVPTAPTISSGVVTSSQFDQIRDAVRFSLNPPIAELKQTTLQSVANSPSNAVITFGAEDVDDDVDGVGGHSTSVDTSRYTARYPGWYQVSGHVSWAGNATGRRWTWFRVNGVNVEGSQVARAATSASDISVPAVTKQVYLSIGDYVELVAMQDSGAALDTYVGSVQAYSHMSVRWVSN